MVSRMHLTTKAFQPDIIATFLENHMRIILFCKNL